jgi:hypothetical protein
MNDYLPPRRGTGQPTGFPCIMCGREPGNGIFELCDTCRQQQTERVATAARANPSTRATITQRR